MQSPKSEIAITNDKIDTLIAEDFSDLTCVDLEKEIEKRTTEWKKTTSILLENTNPFESNRLKLISAEWDFKAHGGSEKSIRNDLKEYSLLNPTAETTFWKKKILSVKKKSEEKSLKTIEHFSAIRRNAQEAWRKEYEKKFLEWQINEIQKQRERYIKELTNWLCTLKQLQDVLKELGIEPGLLWDTSIGKLSRQDIAFLKTWVEYLKKNESVRQLCELMGRLRKAAQSHRIEIINSTIQYSVSAPDTDSKEEIVGIILGRDVENIIPQELALLSDPDVAILFDLKYIENRLMCFSKQGYTTQVLKENIQKKVSSIDEDKMGPIIICVDTSGSMSGPPENIAKALTLTLSARAVAQKRKCYLINFSTGIETIDLSPPKGMNDLIAFLKMSFHGGTDIAPALHEGLRMISKDDYKKADLLIVSDFVLSEIPSNISAIVNKQRILETRFYSLSIGNFELQQVVDGFFDKSWIYDPKTGNVSEINNVIEWISHGCAGRRNL
jgi:uncharacterized protein with von Willebrand factor type A (vWA) domain